MTERFGRSAPALLCAALAAVPLAAAATTATTGTHRASVSASGDGQDNRSYQAALELPLGAHGWLQLGAGRTDASGDGDSVRTDNLGIAGGARGRHFGVSLGYSHRGGDDDLEFGDASAALDWFGGRGGIGLDLLCRDGSSKLVTTITGRRRTYSSSSTQDFDARGVGVHADLDVGARCNVFAGAMHYSYSGVVEDADIARRFVYLSQSAVSRDAAFNSDTLDLGVSYRARRAVFTVEYWRDRALQGGDITNSGRLAVDIPVARWTLTPAVDYSAPENGDGSAFGSMAVALTW